MKKIFLAIAFFMGIGLHVNAQLAPLDPTDLTTNKGFVYASELWMCESYVANIDMSYEAFGKQLSSEGKWYEIIPGTYLVAKEGNNYKEIDEANKLNNGMPVSNIFNAVGRGSGIYEFVYINEKDGFCGMLVGDRAIFRVYVVPELKGFSVITQLCNGTPLDVTFEPNIPADIKDFMVTQMGWSFKYKTYPQGDAVAMPITASIAGVFQYTYEVDDTQGNFSGKHTALNSTKYKCAADARITHTVNLNEGAITTAPGDIEKTFCLAFELLNNTINGKYLVNLNSILNYNAPVDAAGPWTVTAGDTYATINKLTGAAEIDLQKIVDDAVTLPFEVVFTYTYKDNCEDPNSTKSINVKFIFGNTQINDELVDKDTTVCRNLYAGDVSLLGLLQVEVPSTAGTWTDKDNNILYTGTINLSNLYDGERYPYSYFVSPAMSADFCGITNFLAVLGVTVENVDGYNSGQAQICKEVWANKNKKINLSTYIAGLPKDYKPNELKWYIYDPELKDWTLITTDYTQFAVDDKLKVGTNLFKFEYSTKCGDAEGRLFITVTDRITNYENKYVTYCYIDNAAKAIYLEQILGVGGIEGTWSVDSSGEAVNATYFDAATGVFKGREQFESTGLGADKTYIFKFEPKDGNQGCGIDHEIFIHVTLSTDIVTP
ncbi:MAG: hypothetical protein LBL90_14075 [Prevotellaceae bacterium]|jgi:hypothetical protein|nr:hypothetical protein [Prevotellaceae bacterium]